MLKIGHRGARGSSPENTIASFDKAIELGADMIELDVQVCRTGELVVMHDDKVDRTTNGRGKVSEMTFDELRVLDAGNGQVIPTLQEVLERAHQRVKMNVELKGRGTATPTALILTKAIQSQTWNPSDFLVSSFKMKELKKFRKLMPEIPTALLLDDELHPIIVWFHKYFGPMRARRIGAMYVNPGLGMAEASLVQRAHRLGLKVCVYTVNEPSDISRMFEIGVDGIFSDFPDRLSVFTE